MKFLQHTSRRPAIRLAAILAAGLFALSSQAQRNSPVGQWDVVASGGGQNGLMILEFGSDSTVSGLALMADAKRKAPSTIGRGGDSSRTGTGKTNETKALTNWFGLGRVSGQWGFDVKGNVLGYYTYAARTGDKIITNSVSFRGKAKQNKRLTMVAKTTYGQVAFRGIPLRTVVPKGGGSYDGSGWYGVKNHKGASYQEFFELGIAPEEAVPNLYLVNGQGPGYAYPYASGNACIISRQNKIAFSIVEEAGTNLIKRASIGPLKNRFKASAETHGISTEGYIFFRANRYY